MDQSFFIPDMSEMGDDEQGNFFATLGFSIAPKTDTSISGNDCNNDGRQDDQYHPQQFDDINNSYNDNSQGSHSLSLQQIQPHSLPLQRIEAANYEGVSEAFIHSPIAPNNYHTIPTSAPSFGGNSALIAATAAAAAASTINPNALAQNPAAAGLNSTNTSGVTSQQQQKQQGPVNLPSHNSIGGAAAGPSVASQQSDKPKAVGMACAACRRRKIRCDGKRPRCSYCVKKNYECQLTPHKKRGRPRKGEQRGKQAVKEGGRGRNDAAAAPGGNTGLTPVSDAQQRNSAATATDGCSGNAGTTDEGDHSRDRPQVNPPDGGKDNVTSPTGSVEPLLQNLTGIGRGDTTSSTTATESQFSMLAELLSRAQSGNSPEASTARELIMALMSKDTSSSSLDPSILSGLAQGLVHGGDPPALGLASNIAQSYPGSIPIDSKPPQGVAPPAIKPDPYSGDESLQHLIRQPSPCDRDTDSMSPREVTFSPASENINDMNHTPQGNSEQMSLTSKTLWKQLLDSAQSNKSGFVDIDLVRRHIPREIDTGIRAYFTFVHPWIPILHRRTFEAMVRNGTVDPLLYCCVQAIAARFKPDRYGSKSSSPSPLPPPPPTSSSSPPQPPYPEQMARKTRATESHCSVDRQQSARLVARKPYKRGRAFIRLAKTMLPTCVRRYSLATLQAVTLLTQYMSFSGNWREGAAYEKIAVQLAFNGQYHLLDEEFEMPTTCSHFGQWDEGWDLTDGNSVGGLLGASIRKSKADLLRTPTGVLEHEQKRRTWWSIFQMERFNGLAMGRPPIIKPGWHWVWLPCAESLWNQPDPTPDLAWELGLLDAPLRPLHSVSHCRIDLILALIMGQFLDYRTQMFRYFFPRLDQGTLLYDNLPTHTMDWYQRLRSLLDVVETLERRLKQWQQELDRYADTLSSRRHANFELLGYSVRIHIHACVLQIREHLIEDLETRTILQTVAAKSGGGNSNQADSARTLRHSSTSGRDSGTATPTAAGPFQINRFQLRPFETAYALRTQHDHVENHFLVQLDKVAHRSWIKCIHFSDEMARLVHNHWLRNLDESMVDSELCQDLTTLFKRPASADDQHTEIIPPEAPVGTGKEQAGNLEGSNRGREAEGEGGGGSDQGVEDSSNKEGNDNAAATAINSTMKLSSSDEDDSEAIADRFKLLNPQTPYHIFVAGKVQAARLKGIVTSIESMRREGVKGGGGKSDDEPTGGDGNSPKRTLQSVLNNAKYEEALKEKEQVLHRLESFIFALEYSQLYWNSLDFASHLRVLRSDALKH